MSRPQLDLVLAILIFDIFCIEYGASFLFIKINRHSVGDLINITLITFISQDPFVISWELTSLFKHSPRWTQNLSPACKLASETHREGKSDTETCLVRARHNQPHLLLADCFLPINALSSLPLLFELFNNTPAVINDLFPIRLPSDRTEC